ncbi:glycosyltransferase family 2 protein [Desulfovibrio fairfieldensis]|uniref:Glycosyl transferase family 2 n=1 Tax=Desulfovibrio fairfieldensis TaxID=44742 RepID=A0A0X8JLF4_9BACT|nr:glycosyltransferase family 2 protein [Desulfovibrio fairfieldensis]AMD90938.1 glycosyl transferase family 2 [Desulfovibrio fairfieldensis]
MCAHLAVVTWNRLALTRICLESLLARTPPGYTLTIVDNGSEDGSREYLQSLAAAHAHIRLKLLSRNMGVSVAANLAWDDAANDDFYIKLDNDVEILDPLWLERLTRLLAQNPQVGMAAYRLCDWHEPSRQPLVLRDGGEAELTTVCGGGCVCIPRAVYERLGFWNEGYGRYGHEDQDYSWRARKAGYALASVAAEGMVRHLGYAEGMVDADIERGKKTSNQSRLSGDTAYYLNLLLFDEGLLPLRMIRKYLPVEKEGRISFALNPAYRPVQKLLNTLARTVEVDASGELSRLDLSAWRQGASEYESES